MLYTVNADVSVYVEANSEQAAQDKAMEMLGEVCMDISVSSIN